MIQVSEYLSSLTEQEMDRYWNEHCDVFYISVEVSAEVDGIEIEESPLAVLWGTMCNQDSGLAVRSRKEGCSTVVPVPSDIIKLFDVPVGSNFMIVTTDNGFAIEYRR